MAFDTTSYEKLKKSKTQEALNRKNNTISALNTQRGGVENTYKELADTLMKRKSDLTAKNTIDNKNLDTQLATGDIGYGQQRDASVISNTNQSKTIQDWYAKNNIATSTGSADEMGRQSTVLANALGNINTDKNTFDKGIGNDRNLANQGYNSDTNALTNQDNAGQREKAQKLAEIMNLITGAGNTYNSEVQSSNDSIDSQRMQAFNDYNERLRQEEVQKQQVLQQQKFAQEQATIAYNRQVAQQQASARAAASRTSSSRSSGSSKSPQPTNGVNTGISNINDIVNSRQTTNISEKLRILSEYQKDLKTQTGTNAKYLYDYAEKAKAEVNKEMQQFVNVGRYSGYYKFLQTHKR